MQAVENSSVDRATLDRRSSRLRSQVSNGKSYLPRVLRAYASAATLACSAPSRGWATRCTVLGFTSTQGKRTQHGKPQGVVSDDEPDAREGQAGRSGVVERFAVPLKPVNAGGGKGPQFNLY